MHILSIILSVIFISNGGVSLHLTVIYFFKFKYGKTGRMCGICTKLKIKTPERGQWHLFKCLYLLTLDRFHTFFYIVDTEQVHACWNVVKKIFNKTQCFHSSISFTYFIFIWDEVFKSGLSKFLKAVFHKIYLAHSWILCPILPKYLWDMDWYGLIWLQ